MTHRAPTMETWPYWHREEGWGSLSAQSQLTG